MTTKLQMEELSRLTEWFNSSPVWSVYSAECPKAGIYIIRIISTETKEKIINKLARRRDKKGVYFKIVEETRIVAEHGEERKK